MKCANCKPTCKHPEEWAHHVEEAGVCNFCGCKSFAPVQS